MYERSEGVASLEAGGWLRHDLAARLAVLLRIHRPISRLSEAGPRRLMQRPGDPCGSVLFLRPADIIRQLSLPNRLAVAPSRGRRGRAVKRESVFTMMLHLF